MADFKVVDDMKKVEELRIYSYGFNDNTNTFYSDALESRKMLALGAYINDELVGAAYLSGYLNALYIENVFVKCEYRNKKIATDLINYIITNKDIFENFFGKKFMKSMIEPNSTITMNLYEKIGYSEPNSLNIMSRRI